MKDQITADRTPRAAVWRRSTRAAALALTVATAQFIGLGCAQGPRVLSGDDRRPIDRAKVEYPAGFELERFIAGLTSPTAMAFDESRNTLLVAESGIGGVGGPRILSFNLGDGSVTNVYPPAKANLPFGIGGSNFRMYAPIGGMAVHEGKIYVSHRDAEDFGVITALTYDGHHETVVAGLPAQGDNGVTDLAIGPNGRLYFGVGAATNSGVVGLDNWQIGWVREHPGVADRPFSNVALRGYHFVTSNPTAAPLFGVGNVAVTAPFQAFNVSAETKIRGTQGPTGSGKPNAAIYSVVLTGGIASELSVEAHGIRLPRGIAFNEFNRLYATANGMELRGTRPVMDDPDALLRIVPGTWYGWPDYTTNLRPVTDEAFQPPRDMVVQSGYPDIAFIVDHDASNLRAPVADDRERLVATAFPSQSGAGKFDFVPPEDPGFGAFRRNAIVALSGDRAPFATSGKKLVAPIGYKVVRVNLDTHVTSDFVRNTALGAGHNLGSDPQFLERPYDAKFGPDGALYILDFGRMDMVDGNARIAARTGQIFRLSPPVTHEPAPAIQQSVESP